MISLAINTAKQLQEAIISNYIMAGCVAVVAVILLVLIANIIPWQTGSRDTSGTTRRVVWYIIAAATLLVQAALSYVMFYSDITKKALQSQFLTQLFISAGAACLLYIVVTLIIIKSQTTRSKLASIFS